MGLVLYVVVAVAGLAVAVAGFIAGTQKQKPWGKGAAIGGLLLMGFGAVQIISIKTTNSTPGYVLEGLAVTEEARVRQLEYLATYVSEKHAGANVLMIRDPKLPEEETQLAAESAAFKANLTDNTLLGAVVYRDWPATVPAVRANRSRTTLPKWWTAADFKDTVNTQPFPVSVVITWMPLPEDLPKSQLWKDLTIQWPVIILMDPDPRGLETYLSEGIVTAAVFSKPGFNPRALKVVPADAAAFWSSSKLVVTAENLAAVKGQYPQFFTPSPVPFDLKKK